MVIQKSEILKNAVSERLCTDSSTFPVGYQPTSIKQKQRRQTQQTDRQNKINTIKSLRYRLGTSMQEQIGWMKSIIRTCCDSKTRPSRFGSNRRDKNLAEAQIAQNKFEPDFTDPSGSIRATYPSIIRQIGYCMGITS